jgi:hypothetical protein
VLVTVGRAINFDDQFFVETKKIGDVGGDGCLAGEFVAVKSAVSQVAPEFPLGFGLSASE